MICNYVRAKTVETVQRLRLNRLRDLVYPDRKELFVVSLRQPVLMPMSLVERKDADYFFALARLPGAVGSGLVRAAIIFVAVTRLKSS